METSILVLGIVEIIICVISPWLKKKWQYLICNITGNSVLFVQYLIQSCYTEMAVVTIGIVRTFVFYIFEKKDKKVPVYILIIFIIALICASVFTFENYTSLLVVASLLLGTISQWGFGMLTLRICCVADSLLLMTNYSIRGMYTTLISEVIYLISTLSAIFKYHILHNKKVQPTPVETAQPKTSVAFTEDDKVEITLATENDCDKVSLPTDENDKKD